MGNFTAAQAQTGVNVLYFAIMCDKPPHVKGKQVRGSGQGKKQVGWPATGTFGDLCTLTAIGIHRGLVGHAYVQEGVVYNCYGTTGMLKAG